MDFLGTVMGWNWRLRRTRRRWDRLREHALGRKGRLRTTVLKELDDVEDKVRTLEEERLSRRDRTRMLREVHMRLENISDLLEHGEEWLEERKGLSPQQAQRKELLEQEASTEQQD
jgi:hypothetical protein